MVKTTITVDLVTISPNKAIVLEIKPNENKQKDLILRQKGKEKYIT